MKNACYLLLAALVLAVSCENSGSSDPKATEIKAAEPIALSVAQQQKAAADNAFAFDLLREVIATADDSKNAFISPLSATMALGMLYNGTSPAAGAEMAAALGMADLSAGQINDYYRTMREALLKIDPRTTLGIANSIWSREGYPVKPSFIDVNRANYDATIETRDFGPATVREINAWVAGKTNDKIKTIVEEIPAEAVMYLINAVYFKGQWAFEFDKDATRNETFTRADGSRKQVPMMNQKGLFPYYEGAAMQCIELPYGNGAFGMVMLLPAAGSSVDELITGLDVEDYNAAIAALRELEVVVKLPRFRQECEFELNDPLANLGMRRIFEPGGNLSGIADDSGLCVSVVKQKTFVEVNEQGTEAAAVTLIGDITTSLPAAPPTFFADRPFVYLIREKSTGAILFIGRMDDPAN